MKKWEIFFKGVILIIGMTVIAFNILLYNSFEKQKTQTDNISKQQQLDSQVNDNKFKFQQEQIGHISKDIQAVVGQIKDQNDSLSQIQDALSTQKDALLQEVEKRQQVENESKGIQTSLVDIKAEADAIKQDMKTWQKDYVSVLAQLEKKMDDSQDEIKSIKDSLDSLNIPELKSNINSLKSDIDKLTNPSDNSLTSTK